MGSCAYDRFQPAVIILAKGNPAIGACTKTEPVVNIFDIKY